MIQEPLTIGLAEKKDGEEIYALYHSLLDDPYGTWNEEYPSLECVQNDLEENIVYAMRDATGRIVSAIVDEQDIHEFDGLAPWYADVTRWAQLGRLGVAHDAQGHGIARDGAGEGTRLRGRPLSGGDLQHPGAALVCQAELRGLRRVRGVGRTLALLRKAADRLSGAPVSRTP